MDRPPLRLVVCGSVDDGKSTLIGRLLHDADAVPDDQVEALRRDTLRHGSTGEALDFALLVDGLEAERDQGITIDVAHRTFSTARRAFHLADAPGHDQHTRNMATAASNADVAVLLMDASKGLLPQTRRHAVIASLLAIRTVVLAVNKMDLVDWSEARFADLAAGFRAFVAPLGFAAVSAVPVAARSGDNLLRRSARMGWYRGPTLLEHLERMEPPAGDAAQPLRLPVQWVNRIGPDLRGYAGTVAAGTVRAGDAVVVAHSGRGATVARVLGPDGEMGGEAAAAGDAVTVVLAETVDLARGDMLVAPDGRPAVADQLAAHLIWMDEEPMLPGRSYLMKIGGRTVPATVTALKHRIGIDTLEPLAARTLGLNDIGLCNLALAAPVAFDPYAANRHTGSFILIDRASNGTAAAGMVLHPLRRAANVHPQDLAVNKEARAALKGQRPAVVWFTGLSGAGKSTVANLLEARLHARGAHTALLDGDNLRHGLNRDLGFTAADRVENVRRVGEVAKLMVDAGLIVLCCFISPFRAERAAVRALLAEGEFIEAFVHAPLEACIARDPKGLYRRALAGEIRNFTGLDQPYEPPDAPDIRLDTADTAPDALADAVVAELDRRGILRPAGTRLT